MADVGPVVPSGGIELPASPMLDCHAVRRRLCSAVNAGASRDGAGCNGTGPAPLPEVRHSVGAAPARPPGSPDRGRPITRSSPVALCRALLLGMTLGYRPDGRRPLE